MTAQNGSRPAAATTANRPREFRSDEHLRNSNTDLRSRNQSCGDTIIAVLAELFPVFAAERWQPHRPLKIGIHLDLVDRGVLLPDECRVLRRYVSRRMYQCALAAGGPRFDLAGNVAGEVTPEQIFGAKAVLACIDAKAADQAVAVRAAREGERIERKRAKPSPPPPPAAEPRRLGLADLKRAAQERRSREARA
jgi:sRNA-binding protein